MVGSYYHQFQYRNSVRTTSRSLISSPFYSPRRRPHPHPRWLRLLSLRSSWWAQRWPNGWYFLRREKVLGRIERSLTSPFCFQNLNLKWKAAEIVRKWFAKNWSEMNKYESQNWWSKAMMSAPPLFKNYIKSGRLKPGFWRLSWAKAIEILYCMYTNMRKLTYTNY